MPIHRRPYPPQRPCATFEDHLAAVEQDTGVPAEVILGRRRDRVASEARQELMMRLREDHRSLTLVGQLTDRYYRTVAHGVQRAQDARARRFKARERSTA